MYSNWKVDQLKQELKKRGASLRGKKAELVERLEFYDLNFNFVGDRGVLSIQNEDPQMALPDIKIYKDINSDTELPPITKTKIRHYLNCTDKKFHKMIDLYESRHLLSARAALSNASVFVKGHCYKTMKNLQYEIDLKINSYGDPEESQCECPAGSGTNAVCKHVGVVLLAVEQMVSQKLILKKQVCTEKLQSFHVPKKPYTGTPIRGEKLNTKRKPLIFKPYPIENINKINYNYRIRNLVLNFPNSSMPMKQLIEPANPYAFQNDHQYLSVDNRKQILIDLKLFNLTEENINEIQMMTIGQTSSVDWFEYRKNRLTASNFHTICHLKDTTKIKYASQLLNLNQNNIQAKAVTHGKENEPIALAKYSQEYGLTIIACGLFICKDKPFLAASPDGLLGPETIIEVKCPYASRYKNISPTTVPYLTLDENNDLSLKTTSPYYYQVQGQLFCTGRLYCNFIIYTHCDMKIIFIDRDDLFISQMVVKLDDFYHNFFLAEILKKYLYYNYDNYIL